MTSSLSLAQRDWAERNWWRLVEIVEDHEGFARPNCICGWTGHAAILSEDAMIEAVKHFETNHTTSELDP
jgi:hypothetical protein